MSVWGPRRSCERSEGLKVAVKAVKGSVGVSVRWSLNQNFSNILINLLPPSLPNIPQIYPHIRKLKFLLYFPNIEDYLYSKSSLYLLWQQYTF